MEGAHWADRVTAERIINEAIQRAKDHGMTTNRWPMPHGH